MEGDIHGSLPVSAVVVLSLNHRLCESSLWLRVLADTLLDNLTVYEMLAYTAELKNPMKEPFEKKRAKVEMVIQQLGLNGCRGVRIGNPLARGISGEGAEAHEQGSLSQIHFLHAALACSLLGEPEAWSHHMHKIEILQQHLALAGSQCLVIGNLPLSAILLCFAAYSLLLPRMTLLRLTQVVSVSVSTLASPW